MASTSSSASSEPNFSRYDVFLSFRGEDIRYTFTDHLYNALSSAGLYPFRDNDEIDRGEDLQPEIERGIRESRASIIVLSENYANSRWCLDELCLILEQRKERNHFVLPVFYHVDPSHVRKQEKKFQVNVIADTKWTAENVNRWTAALRKIGNMTGEVASGPETEFLKKIVDIIAKRLDFKKVYRQDDLVGMETRDKEIISWLGQSDSQILAIWGMGGSGKTTLARHIVYTNWEKFVSISILEDIGRKTTQQLHQLQEKLTGDILEGKKREIPNVWQGTYTIEKALRTKKALIVLDNIVDGSHLFDLIGAGTETKSKIIITTRERNPCKWFESKTKSWRCREFEMKPFDDGDSLELLSVKAFGSKAPKDGYEDLAKKALRFCDGNPLALKVLGSSLSLQKDKKFWESTLDSLQREVHGDIQSVLITSYNSLPHYSVKELFLHIACFFVGMDKDYVEKILEPDYSAVSGIVTLINSCLLSVSPYKKLMMHLLLQEMARTIVYKQSPKQPGERSRVWRDKESHQVLSKGSGSTKIEGLALDMKVLSQEHVQRNQKASEVTTGSFEKMINLKLLQLNQLKLSGSYGNFPKDLRWLCWREFYLKAIPFELDMGNLVVLDMSCSKLEIFQPPDVLGSLQILNLKDSEKLSEIRNISRLPNLEALILWNCHKLVRVCDTLGDLTNLTLLNITGCENLCKKEQMKLYLRLSASLFGGFSTKQHSFRIPHSLERLFLKDCNIKDTDYFPLSFKDQLFLKYLNLVNSPFEVLPSYNHLKDLRVLDLSRCKKLKMLLCLPTTLSELYIYHCHSLERVTFESHRFTLQEFGYEGCVNLFEVEGFFKLVPLAMLNEADLGHMKWLINYQDLEVCLVGDEQLTNGRSWCLQMLYEFNIMSISLPDLKNPNMMPKYEYMSQHPFLSFQVPPCPKNKRLKGLNLTFKYSVQGEDWVWFAKISTDNGVKLIYNPIVFGKPVSDEVGIWLSYWPIGNTLHIGDKVDASIVVMNGLEILECSAGLVYVDEQIPNVPLKENDEFAEILGGDLSGFRLSTGAYYLCRRDFSELMEAGRLTTNWFKSLIGDAIDYTEVGGWRKTGTPQQPYHSYTELRAVRCIINGPQSDEIYKIAEMSKPSFVNKIVDFTSKKLWKTIKSGTASEFNNASPKDSVTAHYSGLDSRQTIKHKDPKIGSDKKVRTILTHTNSRHAIIAVVVGCLFFISSDNMHTLLQKLDNNSKWGSMYACLFGFFYFFSTPFAGKKIKPSYSNFGRWYTRWMLVAAVYHLPSFRSMGVDMRMNLSLFFTIYISSIFVLLVFHLIFLGLSYVGLVSRVARRRPEILTILQNCVVLSVACCVFYSHCGNNALNEIRLGRRDSGLFSLWINGELSIWLSNVKEEFCKSWFAPVGSAVDYPLLFKWVIYGQFSCTGPCESSDEISPVYSLWATFIGLYMANYVVERSAGWALTHPLSVEETEKLKSQRMKPDFLDMVPWFSRRLADLFKTISDLRVSVTVFVVRFLLLLMGRLQGSRSRVQEGLNEDYLYDHLSERNELWFDFMADTGDDGNSTYSVARLLAQPAIRALDNDSISLPRADLLLIGGNLAHPNASAFSYEKRFFRPFEYALQPPSDAYIAVDKPELPIDVSELKYYDGPQCFVIPGNQDWSDKLETFMRYICQKSWLGGWLMPQKKSFFALQLPKGWWVFGLDLALHHDIDDNQFIFFAKLIEDKVKETDSVIIMTHEPNWILDWYWNNVTGENVRDLVKDHLKGRCKLRMAGDLHHYMRHSRAPSEKPESIQHLLVNGGGGASLHPTHVFSTFDKAYGTTYEMKAAYPDVQDSRRIASGNILNFRRKNWQFDFIGGFIYFILAFSMFPQCNLGRILQKDDTFTGHLRSFFSTFWDAVMYMFGQSYVSSMGAMLLLVSAITFVPSKVSRKRKVVIGILHVSAHLSAALILMLLMELGVEICVQNNLLATSGYHTLYEWYRSVESEYFPDPTGLRARIEQWTFGLYPACIKYFMSAFDVPEVMAVTRANICKNGMISVSGGGAVIYYASVFVYFWVFSTPVVSLVFGSYLYICVNWLNLHFDEAFSSLGISDYKSFTRFHIKEDGDLEIFTLAVDKVPTEWKLDPDWDNEVKTPQEASHHRKFPSKWRANASRQDPVNTVRIVDHFVIQPTHKF